MYKKDFYNWHKVKTRTDKKDHIVFVRRGEVRWVLLGVNIGSESDGKEKYFTRSALVLTVINSKLSLVVPMSTRIKETRGIIKLKWKKGPSALYINQIRVVSSKRILDRMGRISKDKLSTIKMEVRKFYVL